ncbi:selenocysteine-specific translation elongation factor [Piscinibacter sp. HJYY11]|uniref:selenocysteine-specific translation elongation factor n=1 Tax=Piscinibacter sp. HJYY11 TaxID=2801333 RepID=UPI00191D9890|nr:selenocysteine-specific translation elongation factor [Piscinibacter sp. HJYY11]MBL0728011.1 selenocysteine-specific translation elongation factor [Piscinibacter sp. HJYY11]
MIVGTAGHIDHGKTTLVRALTGVDTDRLPEEKRRGISIELGYAFLDTPDTDERIGFIDVPGHERLVHTMLAGATGIDYGLLLVAADDGVMPQTREHLAVLSLLGVSRGAVAVTKIDRAEGTRVAAVQEEVAALLADSSLAGAPVLPVSAHTGAGLADLRGLLFDAARQTAQRDMAGASFRLAIDRVFTLAGVGTVVTGTVHAGQVQVGDELLILPSAKGLRARVRSLHAQNQVVTQAHAGQRCAVALVGVAKDDIARGQWLTAPHGALDTQRLDADLTLWHDEARPLRSGTPVHVHLGACDVMGTVAVLDRSDTQDALAPGARGRVQIVLAQPIAAWRGDRVVLRDNSASRTLAGGEVLDPQAPVRYRRTPQRLRELDAWSQSDAPSRLAALLAASAHGLSLQRWAGAEGRDPAALPTMPEGSLRAVDAGTGEWALGAEHRAAARDAVLSALRTFHTQRPDELGPDSGRLRRLAAPRLPEPLWRALLASLVTEGAVAVRGAFVHLPEHGLRLSSADQRIAQKIAPMLAAAGFEGSWARDLARDGGESEALMRTTLARLASGGELHQVVKDLFYSTACMSKLAALARNVAAVHGGEVTAAAYRDATGLGRKRAIQLLEYFDHIGLLRRVGDVHRLRIDSMLFKEEAA